MTTAASVSAVLSDRYRLDERIAVGGMGEVWRATDTVLGRTVAVKTLKPEYVGDADFRARFRAEARHSARLSHPGIASVYDFGEAPEGAFLVLELVDGEPLSTVLRREKRLPADRVLDLVTQTAAALQAAHDGGVVHRDVKPGNLLVRPDGVVKVTDFGIASATDAVPLTRTGQLVGTALYLSPEQAAGRPAGPASDLYSLGVVAYECLAGARPFPGEQPVAVLMAHLNDPPPALPSDVPAPVAELVLRLLAKDPADRPASAQDLAAEAAGLRGRLQDGPDALLPVEPPSAARTEVAGAPTTALPAADAPAATRALTSVVAGSVVAGSVVAGSVVAGSGTRRLPLRPPVPARSTTGSPARPGATAQTQRWAVRAIAVLLALLALGFGLRSALTGSSVTVPQLATGSTAAQAAAALKAADLTVAEDEQPSDTVPAGQVITVMPAAGSEVDKGSEVTVVVSTGKPPVTVAAAALVGRPAAQVRDELTAAGLTPRLVQDGKGTAVGTVAAVEPVGSVPAGAAVVLHVVPPPPPVIPPPAPAPAKDDGDKGKGK